MIRKLLCWLGFHSWSSYITTNDTILRNHNRRSKVRTTTRTCSICGRKQYKSNMISGNNYYEGVWKWLK